MKFKLRCRNEGDTGEGWWEDYEKPVDDAQKCASDIIAYWNSTLRDHEKPRELLEVVVVDERRDSGQHNWEKTNSFTITGRGGNYDAFRCTLCKITGRRYGLVSTIVRDRDFKAKKFERCVA